jgi:AcrR family transcriptional regulator
MSKKNDKRNRLILAAYHLFRAKSYRATTLAMIAETADVPLGNVYYYFKSKELILMTVVDRLLQELQKTIQQINEQPTQKERIKAFIQYIADNANDLAQYGDSVSTLAKELQSEHKESYLRLNDGMNNILKWMTQQFLGLATNPQTQAHALIQRLYGIISLATTLNQPQYILDYCEVLSSEF